MNSYEVAAEKWSAVTIYCEIHRLEREIDKTLRLPFVNPNDFQIKERERKIQILENELKRRNAKYS